MKTWEINEFVHVGFKNTETEYVYENPEAESIEDYIHEPAECIEV